MGTYQPESLAGATNLITTTTNHRLKRVATFQSVTSSQEHVLISIFANAGSAFGNGSAYAVGIVTIIKVFYRRNISFLAGWLLIITTQVLGYGWAGLLRKYVVEPGPHVVAQALHEKDDQRMSRAKFFLIALICSFCWHRGLGLGAITLDWSAVASFLFSPLICPFFAIVNVFAGIHYYTHVALFYGREIYERFQASYKGKEDIHTRLMRKYKDIPSWWFNTLLDTRFDIITEYVMGIILPGRPIANVCFKVYGYIHFYHFLTKFGNTPGDELGASVFRNNTRTNNISVAWWLLNSIENICQDDLLPPDSPWTCPGDRVFFDASVIWGLPDQKGFLELLGATAP
ncbi:hypothetical protein HAX54_012873 [Datura stramonium]|uniref:Uncharacterized protein n=1 Tax=Datura stramonium TaxID=4076 RepID=A0ABS8RXX0_DATST|nr:hypothetical protein [Datura stramonium]